MAGFSAPSSFASFSATPPAVDTPSLLLLACGNDLRGDDALGPAFIAEVERWQHTNPSHPFASQIEPRWQLQWSPETAFLFLHRRAILLIDAYFPSSSSSSSSSSSFPFPRSLSPSLFPSPDYLPPPPPPPPLILTPLTSSAAAPDALLLAVGTHYLPPSALLAAAQLLGIPLPPIVWLLQLPGEACTLGASLTPTAQTNLAAALQWFWSALPYLLAPLT